MFEAQQLKVIRFCAEECHVQQSGERSVYYMLNAWQYASTLILPDNVVDAEFIYDIGALVEPTKNARRGWRRVPVRIQTAEGFLEASHPDHPAAPNEIADRMARLLKFQKDLTPEEFYREYEIIHPFIDGNGRTGVILFNLLRGTLHAPEQPNVKFG